MIARVLWAAIVLCVSGLFIFIAYDNLRLFYSRPKTVNVEVTFTSRLKFPAVTVCNQNAYRLTAVQESGLYDTLLEYPPPFFNSTATDGDSASLSTSQPGFGEPCKDRYGLLGTLCSELPANIVWKSSLNETTRTVCKQLCSSIYPLWCSSFFYRTKERQCILTSFAGVIADADKCATLEDGYEYYRRGRCFGNGEMICDFETPYPSDQCALSDDRVEFGGKKIKDVWQIVSARANFPPWDHTLSTGAGHYLYLLQTDKRPQYSARVQTPFFNSTGKCLTFYYDAVGHSSNKNKVTLNVFARKENLRERLLQKEKVTLVSDDNPDSLRIWKGMHLALPAGLHQVIIEGERIADGSSGIFLDDLRIGACEEPEESCIHTRLALDYRGKLNVSKKGNPCRPWSDGRDCALFPDSDICTRARQLYRDQDNFCRAMPAGGGSVTPGLACFVDRLTLEDCEPQPYCACEKNQVKCGSGFCLPHGLVCDGQDDCWDSTDETLACRDKMQVTCDFEEEFMCGYKYHTANLARWQRLRGPGPNKASSPKSDRKGTSLGNYMIVSTSQTTRGDQAVLISPRVKVPSPRILEFAIFMNHPSNDNGGLQIYRQDWQGFNDHLLLELKGHQGDRWIFKSVCVPEGSYNFAFQAVAGETYFSDIAIDDVRLTETACAPEKADSPQNTEINCDFGKGFMCGYRTETTSQQLTWTYIMKEHLEEALRTIPLEQVCNANIYALSGSFDLRGYPKYENYMRCKQTIPIAEGSQLRLSFKGEFEIEYHYSCGWDYLQLSEGDPQVVRDKICGRERPSDISFDQTPVELYFKSDSYISRTGYSVDYESTIVNTTNYSLTVMYQSNTPGPIHLEPVRAATDEAKLLSAPFTLSRPGCIRARFHSPGNFRIDLWHQNSYSVEQTIVLDMPWTGRVLKEKAFFWADVASNLSPVKPDVTKYRLVITSFVNVYAAHYPLVLDHLSIEEETCDSTLRLQNGTQVDLECNFEEAGNMCSYADASEGSPALWMMAQDGSNATVLRTVIGDFPAYARLQSLEATLDNVSCLCAVIDPYLSFTPVSFMMVESEEEEPTVLNSMYVYGKGQACTELPVGTYRVQMRVESDEHYFRQSVIDIRKIYLQNIYECETAHYVYDRGSGSGSGSGEEGSESGSGSGLEIGVDPDFGSGTMSGSGSADESGSESGLEPHSGSGSGNSGSGSGQETGSGNSGSGTGGGSGSGSGNSGSGTGGGSGSGSGNSGSGSGQGTGFDDDEGVGSDVDDAEGNSALDDDEVIVTDLPPFEDPVLERVGGTNMTHVIDRLGHPYSEFIFSCYWQGQPCPDDLFSQSYTEYGLCQTFNWNINSPEHTNQTGGDNGVQLLLNIEQYEYVKLRSVDAGVKVHLHLQDGIADVKNLGFAAPVGMHSLAPITYTISKSLPHPYGNCTKKRNLAFFDGKDYSRQKCQIECLTNFTVEKCHCRDIYMPGDSPVCDLNHDLRCLSETRDSGGGAPLVNCDDCEDECEVKRNAVSLSYAQLSGLSISALLDNERDKIASQYHKALEIKHRVEEDLLLGTIRQLLDVKTKYSTFRHYLEFSVLDSRTSVTKRLELLAQNTRERLIEDVGKLFHQLRDYSATYKSYYSPYVSSTRASINDFANKASLMSSVLLSWHKPSPFVLEFGEQLQYETLDAALKANGSLNLFLNIEQLAKETGKEWPGLLPISLPSNETEAKRCKDVREAFLGEDGPLSAVIHIIQDTGIDFSGPKDDSLFALLTRELSDARLKALDLCDCYIQYEDLIETIWTWMSSIKPLSNDIIRYDSSEIIDRLEIGEQYLHLLFVNYTENIISKHDLASALGSTEMTSVVQDIARIYEDVNENIVSPLQSVLTDLNSITKDAYLTGLHYAGRFEKHFSQTYSVMEHARYLSLWKKPMPSIDSPQLVRYTGDGSNLGHLWPPRRSVEVFMQTSGEALVEQTVRDFYQGMSSQLTEMKVDVKSMQRDLSTAIEKLYISLEEYNATSEIDEKFILKNFLKLDIFYGELKYELMEQKEGYTMQNYFSDMGGYMGLLLGASAITIFELIDLLIYNSAVKCRRKRNRLIKVQPAQT